MGKRTLWEIRSKTNPLKDESEWYKIPNHHPAIIDKALFEQVQAKMLHFKCVKRNREYTLRKKVFCGVCGHAMPRTSGKNHAFLCQYTIVDENAGCHGLQINERELENLLFEVISKQAPVILGIDSLADTGELELRSAQQAEHEKLIARLNEEKRGLYERYIMKEIDTAWYKAQS